ncbi:MAG: hypothetical protein N3A62_10220 [Thermodesulfovibrionales bacterium]|nr:hypothetical protein [Thermodesulfovibrionales bacterium]
MKTLGNILWHIPCLGFISAILSYLAGLLLTVTVIASPIGLGLMEYGKYLVLPFGHAMVSKSDLNIPQGKIWKTYSTIIMILWIPFGILFCILTVIQIVMLALSIIGLPAAIVLSKSLGTWFNPVNKKCVSSAVAEEIERRKAQEQINKYVQVK